ncbi:MULTISPECIES: hypothetical protein [unclassified Bradyrhizobium]|jgi:hypothetical protein|uniref:hypothetical protein n=1 Tax=unclassified Bradyrhizobium TaxID=2631580 RepID=UPI001FF710C7|nr:MULTISPECIES: hypothetical protein [unclassified Bradyrhizobium]MCK1534656.1 hypothetical protein [Bradyrhizobium sp. 176]MCK1557893.1 hypothetical protein [Bradyrhizobium sp. 171]UPJ98257.1 hypothetical protein IVB07_12545 [Bradyrhizobium sp. 172]
MGTEATWRHQRLIQIAMLQAEKNGYPTDAWRLFEAQAETILAQMSKSHSGSGSEHLTA